MRKAYSAGRHRDSRISAENIQMLVYIFIFEIKKLELSSTMELTKIVLG